MMNGTATALGRFLLGEEESAAVRRRLVTGVGGALGLRIVFSALSFVVSIFLARVLRVGGIGAYNYAFSWVVLLSIPCLLGMDQLLIRDVAGYRARSEWGLIHGLLRKANWSVLLASVTLGLLGLVISWAFHGERASQSLFTFWISLLLLPLITLARVRQGALQGLHQVVRGSLPEQLIQPALLLTFVAAASLWTHQLTAPLAMWLTVLAAVMAFAVGVVILYRSLPHSVINAEPVYNDFAWTRSSWSLVFLSSMGVVFGQADTLILGAIKGTQEVGIYTVADRTSEVMTFFLVIQNAAFASTAASLYAVGDLQGLQRLVTKLARWTLLATLPIAVALIGFARWFLSHFYGFGFTEGKTALIVLSIGQLFNVAMGSVGVLLTMTGHERYAAAGMAAGAAANIGLNLLLVPRWGLEGAAIANALSMVIWNVFLTVGLYKKVGLHATALGKIHVRNYF